MLYKLTPRTATCLKQLIAKDAAATASRPASTRVGSSSPALPNPYSPPFAVRYSASCGGWIIYLPDGSLVVDGESVADFGLSAAQVSETQTDYGAGWYTLPGASGSVILYITFPASSSEDVTASFSAPESSGSSTGTTWQIPVATLNEDYSVVQGLVGALVIGGGSSYAPPATANDIALNGDGTASVVRVYAQAGVNTALSGTDTVVTAPEVYLRLDVDDYGTRSLSVVFYASGVTPSPADNSKFVRLYTMASDLVTVSVDWRTAPQFTVFE